MLGCFCGDEIIIVGKVLKEIKDRKFIPWLGDGCMSEPCHSLSNSVN